MKHIFLPHKTYSYPLRSVVAALCTMLSLLSASGQESIEGRELYTDWETFVSEYFQQQDGEEEQNRFWMDELEAIHHAPINLNTVSRSGLMRIPFLSEAQADSLLLYRERRKRFTTLGELQFIRGIDYYTRRWLSLFVYAGDTLIDHRGSLRRQLTQGKHEIETRLDIPLYLRAGYATASEEEIAAHPSRYYLGSPWANTLRYRYRYRQTAAYGITLQKDAGEPFATQGNRPYDHTSAYLYLRPGNGRTGVWIGDYLIRAGQGLLLAASSFSMKAGAAYEFPRWNTRVTPHTGSDEAAFLRGAAVQTQAGQWTLTAFASYKRMDGRVNGDSITGIKTDGLHRTKSEIEDRNTQARFTIGGNASYFFRQTHFGISGYYARYHRPIRPRKAEYNRFYLRGQTAAGISTDYQHRTTRWVMTGEIAIDRHLHPATTHTLQYTPDGNTTLTLQARYFSSRYVAPMAEPLQEGSQPQNELGLLLGGTFHPTERWQLSGYVDAFCFPGLRSVPQARRTVSRPIWKLNIPHRGK